MESARLEIQMSAPTLSSEVDMSSASCVPTFRHHLVGAVARLMGLALALAVLVPSDLRTPIAAAGREGRAPQASIVLRGTIIIPEGVIRHGYLGILNGRIVSVSETQPDLPDAIVINTGGVILPGFVDAHNHVPWNVLPRWAPGGGYTNQPDWADSPEFAALRAPFDRLLPSFFCDMNAWGELRALVGGTTAILATQPVPCIHGLVRNLDFNSGFYGSTELNRERVFNAGGFRFPPPSDAVGRATFVATAQLLIANPFYEALVLHAAEGTDAYAVEQFEFLESEGLLNPKGVLIHGVALNANHFQAMADAGTALVWSPRSNLELYGATANVGAALDAGVEVALAPDWGLTGSSNMLDELNFVWRWNREHLGGRLTNRRLVDMVTSIPAHILGIDDEVGEIRPGLRADLLVVRGGFDDPLRAVIEARAGDVQLVLIDGVPIYGGAPLMDRFWSRADLEEIEVEDERKMLASSAAGIGAAATAGRLVPALQGEGTALARLVDGGPPFKVAAQKGRIGVDKSENRAPWARRSINDPTDPMCAAHTLAVLRGPSGAGDAENAAHRAGYRQSVLRSLASRSRAPRTLSPVTPEPDLFLRVRDERLQRPAATQICSAPGPAVQPGLSELPPAGPESRKGTRTRATVTTRVQRLARATRAPAGDRPCAHR